VPLRRGVCVWSGVRMPGGEHKRIGQQRARGEQLLRRWSAPLNASFTVARRRKWQCRGRTAPQVAVPRSHGAASRAAPQRL